MKKRLLWIVLVVVLGSSSGMAQDPQKYFDQGKERYNAGHYEKALEYFVRYAEQRPDEWATYNWMGACHYFLNHYHEAATNLIRANQLKESYSNYYWLGRCYEALEDYESALYYNLKTVELHPKDGNLWRIHNRLGWNYYFLQMFYDALDQFREAIQINPSNDNYVGLCKTYWALEDYDRAQEILNALMNKVNSEAEKSQLQYLLMYNHVSLGRIEDAFMIFGKKSTLGLEIKSIQNGVKIITLVKNGPADLAGLRIGDILIEMNGVSLKNKTAIDFVSNVVPQFGFGSKIQLKVYRDGVVSDKFMIVGISPEIYRLSMNDPDLMRQREDTQKSASKKKVNVAVMELIGNGISGAESSALTTRLRSELFNTTRYNVLERENMNKILEEIGFQQMGATSNENLIEAGKLLNVQYMVGGSVSRIGQVYSVSLKMVNIETGKIQSLATEDFEGTIESLFLSGIKKAVFKLIQ